MALPSAFAETHLCSHFRNGPELVRSYLERTPCERAICHDGIVIQHPAGTAGLAQLILEVSFEQVYTGDFFSPQPGDTIIDAGANIGMFSLAGQRHFVFGGWCFTGFSPRQT